MAVVLFFMTAGTSFGLWKITHVPTDVGIIPVEHTFGYVIHSDNFYKDFTK